MGAVVPLITSTLVSQGIGLAANELSRQKSKSDRGQALEQLKARQQLSEQQNAQDAALERERIALNTKNANEERRDALKRAVARQRASFGSQGVGSGTGSSQAVLLGLFEESDDERKRRESLDNVRLTAIDQDLSQAKALNVLQRTQLEERGKINNTYANISRVTSIAGRIF